MIGPNTRALIDAVIQKAGILCSLSEAALASCAVLKSILRKHLNAAVRTLFWPVSETIPMSAIQSPVIIMDLQLQRKSLIQRRKPPL